MELKEKLDAIFTNLFGSSYSRMDPVKFVVESL